MSLNKTFTRREIALLGANVGMATLAGAGLSFAPAARAQEVKAMLGHFPSANQQNFSKATGSMQKALGPNVKIDFISVAAGPQILTAMAANNMDACNMGSSPMIVGFAQGLPVSMVYMHKVVRDSECLVVRNDAGIKELKDLRGKKIGCPLNTSAHFGILSAMKIAGLGAADVTLVNLRPDAIPAAWQRKEIDGAYIWHPVLLNLEKENGTTIFRTGDLLSRGSMVFDGLVARDAFKKQHPDLLLAYLKEIDRINTIYRNSPDEVVDVMAPFLQAPKDVISMVVRTTHTITPREMLTDAWMGAPGARDSGILRAIRDQAEFLRATDQLKSVPPDFSRFVDSSFVARMV